MKMFSSELKNWPIFATLESEFTSKFRMVIVYGNCGHSALAVTKDEVIYALGMNKNGCLGIGNNLNVFYPIEVKELSGTVIKTFVCGKDHVLALTQSGLVYSWGCNTYGQLGNGHYERRLRPTLMSKCLCNEFIVDIACGSYHSLALTNKGQVYSWGCKMARCNTPIKVEFELANKNIVCISCGKGFSMMVTDKGEVYGWGENDSGQLGVGDFTNKSKPCKVKGLTDIIIEKVVCGDRHTLALSFLGVLFVWGGNNYGQLGFGDKTNACTPKKLEIGKKEKVLDIAASYCNDISVAMGEKNKVFIWGKCLGQNITVPTYRPLKCLHDAFALFALSCAMHQPLTLYDEEAEPSLIDCFWMKFNDPATSDLIIKAQEKPIHVHEAILKIRCQYLRIKFEESWDKNNESVIEIEEFSYLVYYNFLQYLYTDEINLPIENVLELLNLANIYSENGLKDLCTIEVEKKITVKNVLILYEEAIKYKFKEIEEYCFNFALNHIIAVLETPHFAELHESILKTFMIKVVKAGAFKT